MPGAFSISVWLLLAWVCFFSLFIIVWLLFLDIPHEISRIYRIKNLCDRFCKIEKRSIVTFFFRLLVLIGLIGTMVCNDNQKVSWKSYSAMEIIVTAVAIPIILDWITPSKSTSYVENENGIERK